MRLFQVIALSTFLTIGFLFPGCEETDSCDGVVFKLFFDVEGIDMSIYSNFEERTSILPNDTVSFEELDRFFVDYIVDYLATAPPHQDWLFSLMPSAYACSYIPGNRGSKEEALVDFSIITLNDFDADHLANSNINDLFDYHGFFWELLENPIPLEQFLANQSGNLDSEDMILSLNKAPESTEEFKVRIIMELSTGEIYEVESDPIFIRS